MKTRFLLLCVLSLLLAGCGNQGQGYTINGTLPSVKYDGEWMYLVPTENPKGRVDSAQITNGSFRFSGKGEEMRILRMRHVLRLYVQELIVVTEPGTIAVKADSIGSVTGTPQNDALQSWKESREKRQAEYHKIRTLLKKAKGADSLDLLQARDALMQQEGETNFALMQEQGANTLGTFLYKRVRGSLTKEQQEQLDEILQK